MLKNGKNGRDYPLSTTPEPKPYSPIGEPMLPETRKVPEIIASIRENRAENLRAKGEKLEGVAQRKLASAEKIAARKAGKAEIIRARAELARAKRGRY